MSLQINCGQIEETNSNIMPFLDARSLRSRPRGVEVVQAGIEGVPLNSQGISFSPCSYDNYPSLHSSSCENVFF